MDEVGRSLGGRGRRSTGRAREESRDRGGMVGVRHGEIIEQGPGTEG